MKILPVFANSSEIKWQSNSPWIIFSFPRPNMTRSRMLQSFKISVNWAKEDLLPLNRIHVYHNQYEWNLVSYNISNAATLFNKSNWVFVSYRMSHKQNENLFQKK